LIFISVIFGYFFEAGVDDEDNEDEMEPYGQEEMGRSAPGSPRRGGAGLYPEEDSDAEGSDLEEEEEDDEEEAEEEEEEEEVEEVSGGKKKVEVEKKKEEIEEKKGDQKVDGQGESASGKQVEMSLVTS
jgi:hypothetical protein